MRYQYIIYKLFKTYDFLLSTYFIIKKKIDIIYTFIYQNLYKSKNNIYIFNKIDNNNFIYKQNYNLFIKNIKLKEIINQNNSKYFFIHEINYENVNYILNNKILDTNNIQKTNYKFILVEIINSNNKIDITHFINNIENCYYLIDNNLFDIEFMIWLKYNKFNVENNYKINIIDNNIKMIDITKNQYIKLLKDSYRILEY